MEELIVRYHAVNKSLKTLDRSLNVLNDRSFVSVQSELRDSVIQRFEYSIDTLWKLLKEYLRVEHKVIVEPSTPKAVFRECLNAQLIDAEQFHIAIKMIESRNLTSHTYNEALAKEICTQIPEYYILMQQMVAKMKINT